MKGDFTRSTYRPEKHYSSVRMQQGRVQLDADWNEQLDISAHRAETESRDVIGSCGSPRSTAGFALAIGQTHLPAAQQGAAAQYLPLGSGDFFISAGRYYADGLLCENEGPLPYTQQPDPPELVLPDAPGIYLAYLDVWERHVTALEDPDIREVALGGPDTATRTKVVWQVKLRRIQDQAVTCDSTMPEWTEVVTGGSGRLGTRAQPSVPSEEPCVIEPGAGYRRLENQLYRVEVHQSGALGSATFKWSRDNGSIVATWLARNGNDLTVSSMGRDRAVGFANGDWVELTDDARELQGRPGTMVRLIKAEGQTLTIDPATATDTVDLADFPRHPRVRRWNTTSGTGAQTIETPVTNDGYLELEDGIQVRFEAGTYATGDYWLIPARTATGGVEWPFTEPQPPQGIRHHYCRLGLLTFDGSQYTAVQDCRTLFPPVTELTGLFYVSGDGQEASGGQPLPKPIQVGVANGKWPVVGATVQFHVSGGTGRLTAGAATGSDIRIATDSAGVASCTWTLDGANQSQQVEAQLLDGSHLPVRFNATLSQPGGIEPGVHVERVLVGNASLRNDTDVTVSQLAAGIQVDCDRTLFQDSIRGKPTCLVTLDLPFPFNSADMQLWGSGLIGVQPLVLDAEVNSDNQSIFWRLGRDTAAWLQGRLFPMMTEMKRGNRVLVHLTLKGNFIWDQKELLLDGDAFGGRSDNSQNTDIRLPSGDGRRGGDFEMWFWLIPQPPPTITAPTLTATIVTRPTATLATATIATRPTINPTLATFATPTTFGTVRGPAPIGAEEPASLTTIIPPRRGRPAGNPFAGIRGLSAAQAAKLRAAGIGDLRALARVSPREVMAVLGLRSQARATSIIAEARRLGGDR